MPKTLSQVIRRIVRDEARRGGQPFNPQPVTGFSSRQTTTSIPVDPNAAALAAYLTSGGDVVPDSPASFIVIQRPLTGVSEGVAVALATLTYLQVPTTILPTTYYVAVSRNGIAQIVSIPTPGRLITAVIHLPYADTYEIRDAMPDSPADHAGWIEPFDSLTTGGFDIDSDDPALRNAIQEIAAEGIIGDLVLSQGLKITNPAGTLEMDSQTIKIRDGGGRLRALFDEDSIDFYDGDGFKLATFGAAGAKIGNIQINPTNLRSADFVAGSRGFEIRDTGDVEFGDGYFRGTLVVPALSTATYDSGTQSFRLQRRRHLVQDVTVWDGKVVPFDNPNGPLIDSHGYAVPGFEQKPVVIIQENIVPIYDGRSNICSGTNVVLRRLFAEPLMSSGSKWDSARITATLIVSGSAADGSVISHSGTTLGWPNYNYSSYVTGQHAIFYLPLDTSETVEIDPTDGIRDGFHFPMSGTLTGVSGNKVTVDLVSKVGQYRNDVLVTGTVQFNYIVRVGKSGTPFITTAVQSGTATVAHSKAPGATGQDAVTFQRDRFTFSNLDMALDWAVKVDYYGYSVLSESPAGSVAALWPRFDAVNYHSIQSGNPITYAVIDMEITED